MATGNLKVKNAYCKKCDKDTKAERNGIIWGMGDFVLVVLTGGVWAVLRLVLNALTNPWRCSECGSKI